MARAPLRNDAGAAVRGLTVVLALAVLWQGVSSGLDRRSEDDTWGTVHAWSANILAVVAVLVLVLVFQRRSRIEQGAAVLGHAAGIVLLVAATMGLGYAGEGVSFLHYPLAMLLFGTTTALLALLSRRSET